MTKNITISFLFSLIALSAFSQVREQDLFVKRIEYNFYVVPMSDVKKENLNSKEGLEKLFWGNFNSPVEFSFLPSAESSLRSQTSSFRILRNPSNTSYILEVKYISNYEAANEEARKKYSSIGVTGTEAGHISDERKDKIANHNNIAFIKREEELLKLYKVESLSFTLSNQFAEKMHEKMVSVIDDYNVKGAFTTLIDVFFIFRAVVGDEVWTLKIRDPKGDVLKMFDLCREIIADAKENKLDEKKYMAALNSF